MQRHSLDAGLELRGAGRGHGQGLTGRQALPQGGVERTSGASWNAMAALVTTSQGTASTANITMLVITSLVSAALVITSLVSAALVITPLVSAALVLEGPVGAGVATASSVSGDSSTPPSSKQA